MLFLSLKTQYDFIDMNRYVVTGNDYSYYKFEINISNSKFKRKPKKEELEEVKQREEKERKGKLLKMHSDIRYNTPPDF